MKLRYLGHSCFVVEGSERIIIDPFINGNPLSPVSVDEIKVDVVAVTHGHRDHLGDAIEIAKNNDATLVAIHEIAVYASSKGARAEGINMGGGIKIGDTEIIMVQAWHSSGIDEANYEIATSPAALIIKAGKTIYHAGDTALFSDMKLIGELYGPDVALLPIGGRYTMDARQAVKAAEMVGAAINIPMHYNTFEAIRQDPEEFRRMAEERGIKVVVLKPGEELNLD
ncbi:MAG: metal-dependent hydrolase [Thermoplasmata archaeon]|nr:metal-dependent hydrolase [Thermoplasmata archaeon]